MPARHVAGIILERRGPPLPTTKYSVRGYVTIRGAWPISISAVVRGQRYCDPGCRAEVRRQQQRRTANQRYRPTESGRKAHKTSQKTCSAIGTISGTSTAVRRVAYRDPTQAIGLKLNPEPDGTAE
jgi:hypothetical protein